MNSRLRRCLDSVPAVVVLPILIAITLGSGRVSAREDAVVDLPDARVARSYWFSPAVDGLTSPIAFEWEGRLPEGLRFLDGRIEGTPVEAVVAGASIDLTVTDALGVRLKRSFRLKVRPALEPLTIVTRALPSFVLGEEVDVEVGARGGEGRLAWEVETQELPTGLTVEGGQGGTGLRIRGRPVSVGPVRLSVAVHDEVGDRAGPSILLGRVGPAVAKPLEGVRTIPRVASLGQSYQHTFQVRGGVPPYRWSLVPRASLESLGMTWDGERGILDGTPSAMDEVAMAVSVVDAAGGQVALSNLAFRVEAPSGPVLRWAQTTLPEALVGRRYQAGIVVLNARGRVRWKPEGMPDGFRGTGEGSLFLVDGIAPSPGSLSFRLAVEDQAPARTADGLVNRTVQSLPLQTFVLECVSPPPPPPPPAPELTTVTLPDAIVGHEYDVQLAARGGADPVSYVISNSPVWMNADSAGRIRGIPSSPGTWSVDATAVDGAGVRSRTVSLTIRSVAFPRSELSVPEEIPVFGTVGSHIALTVPVVGGTKPYRGEVREVLPEGLEFDTNTLRLSGTLRVPGITRLRLRVGSAGTEQDSRESVIALNVLRDPVVALRGTLVAAAVVLIVVASWVARRSRRGRSETAVATATLAGRSKDRE